MTMKRQRCWLPPLGARVPASITVRSSASGIGPGGMYRRARCVWIASKSPMSTAIVSPPRSELEAVELGRVAARDLELVLGARVFEVAHHDVLRVWPGRSLMRIVGGPHELVHANKMTIGHADVVVDVGAMHLALEVLPRLQAQL